MMKKFNVNPVDGYQAHLFICTKNKDDKECCGEKGSQVLHTNIKQQAKKRWGNKVRINASGCLGYCSQGIAAVLYPQGKWLVGLTSEDDKKINSLLEQSLDKE
jgi:(2Fe-2S) ferredoxin